MLNELSMVAVNIHNFDYRNGVTHRIPHKLLFNYSKITNVLRYGNHLDPVYNIVVTSVV